MNIDEMKAGPELNALVAELVMGWVWRWEWSWTRGLPKEWHRQLVSTGMSDEFDTQPDIDPADVVTADRIIYVRPYSTDHGLVCQVLEQMYSDGWVVDVGSLALIPRGWRSHMVNSFCDDFHSHPICVEANGDTIALAVCRASVKAKSVEEVQRETVPGI